MDIDDVSFGRSDGLAHHDGVGKRPPRAETGRTEATAGGRRQANGRNLNSSARPEAHPAKRRASGDRPPRPIPARPCFPRPTPLSRTRSRPHPAERRASGRRPPPGCPLFPRVTRLSRSPLRPSLGCLWLWRSLSRLAIRESASLLRATRFAHPRVLAVLSPWSQFVPLLVLCGGRLKTLEGAPI